MKLFGITSYKCLPSRDVVASPCQRPKLRSRLEVLDIHHVYIKVKNKHSQVSFYCLYIGACLPKEHINEPFILMEVLINF